MAERERIPHCGVTKALLGESRHRFIQAGGSGVPRGAMGWGHQLGSTPRTTPEGFFPHHSPVIKHSQGCQALELPTALCVSPSAPSAARIKAGAGKDQGVYSYKVITVR